MAEVAVVGAGMIPFGKYPDRSLVDLGAEAAFLTLKDSGLNPKEVDIAYFANGFGGRLFGDFTIGQNVLWQVGINRIPVVNVENACTSGSTAFYLAYNSVAAEQVEIALAVGAEKMYVPELGLLNSGQTELDTQLGGVAPASFAMRATRYLSEFDATPAQLAQVAVKNRGHAALNSMAQFRDAITVDEVLASPLIVDPLTRLMCCPNADGAAAVILASPAVARRLGRAVRVNTALLFSGSYENPQDQVRWETDYRACQTAYEKTGIDPKDLDLAECHDAFTISEILHYEAMGLCPTGEGAKLAAEGATALGGRIPVNTSGGLLSRGHPVGATGIAQVLEIVTQLRQEAGNRQVEGARIGLSQCMGADKEGDTKSCTVAIFSV